MFKVLLNAYIVALIAWGIYFPFHFFISSKSKKKKSIVSTQHEWTMPFFLLWIYYRFRFHFMSVLVFSTFFSSEVEEEEETDASQIKSQQLIKDLNEIIFSTKSHMKCCWQERCIFCMKPVTRICSIFFSIKKNEDRKDADCFVSYFSFWLSLMTFM